MQKRLRTLPNGPRAFFRMSKFWSRLFHIFARQQRKLKNDMLRKPLSERMIIHDQKHSRSAALDFY